jgi:hypothetical protein
MASETKEFSNLTYFVHIGTGHVIGQKTVPIHAVLLIWRQSVWLVIPLKLSDHLLM